MKRTHRLAAVAAALALLPATGIAACDDDDGGGGGLDPDAYIEELNSAQLDFVNEVTSVISGAPPSDPEGLADAADELESVTNASADEIEAIEPPDDVADLHSDFVAEMRKAATEFGDAGEAFATGDPQEIAQAATQLQSAATGIQTNLQQIVDEMNSTLQG